MSALLDHLRTGTCASHQQLCCPRCIASQHTHETFWARFPAVAVELGWDDIAVEVRNEITIVGYCRCGRWFTCRDEHDRRTQLGGHHRCRYRHQIAWQTTPQLQLF